MKRLLLATIDFPPKQGGVAKYLDALALYFKDQIQVYAPKAINRPYKVFKRNLLSRFMYPKWFKAILAFAKYQMHYDILITSHVLPIGTAAMYAKRLTKRPYVVIVHGMDIALVKKHSWKKELAKRVLQEADLVIANSLALENEVRSEFGLTKTVTVYPTISELPKVVKKEEGEEIRLLTLSRLVERKGHLRSLEAFRALLDRGVKAHYDIVGDGPMYTKIVQEIERLNLKDFVSLHRDVTDEAKSGFYKNADIFLMPTDREGEDREGFGIVYIEAASFGLPSIASNMAGVDEAVLDDKTGLLVKDQKELNEILYRLSSHSALREKLGEGARVHAENFLPEKQFSVLEKYFN